MRTPLASAMWPRSATRPSLTSVIAVAPRSAAIGPSGVRRLGTAVRGHHRHRRAEAAAEHGEPGRGPAEPAGHRDDVAGPRAVERDRRAALQVAERGDAEHDDVGRGHVAADDRGADLAALLAHAGDQRRRPSRPRASRGRRSRRAARSGTAPIATMSAKLRAAALCPMSLARRPVAAEVPVLDQQVGGGDHPAVAAWRPRRRRRPGRAACVCDPAEAGGDPLDQPELAEVRNGDDPQPLLRPATRIACATFYRSRRARRREDTHP